MDEPVTMVEGQDQEFCNCSLCDGDRTAFYFSGTLHHVKMLLTDLARPRGLHVTLEARTIHDVNKAALARMTGAKAEPRDEE